MPKVLNTEEEVKLVVLDEWENFMKQYKDLLLAISVACGSGAGLTYLITKYKLQKD